MSFAWIFMAPIWPAFALLRTSACSFFSWFSSLTRSRSSSRCVFSRERWCLRRRSAGVMRLPKAHSTMFMVAGWEGLSWWAVKACQVIKTGREGGVMTMNKLGTRHRFGIYDSDKKKSSEKKY
jgi:hypothetical protein